MVTVPSASRRSEDRGVVAETIARVDLDRFIAHYEEARGSSRKTRASGTSRSD